jgi:plasmid stabilization system protein ParE
MSSASPDHGHEVNVEWSETALRRLKQLLEENTQAAWHAYDRIEQRVLQLEHFSELSPNRGPRARRALVVYGTPYIIIYTFEPDAIRIRAIASVLHRLRGAPSCTNRQHAFHQYAT